MVRLLNDDISIETALLLAGRMDITPVLPDDLTDKQIEDLTDNEIESLTEEQTMAPSVQMFRPMAEHSETLRTLIDEWIDSGIQTDGSEQPRSRHLSDESTVEYVEAGEIITAVAKPKSRIRRMVNDYQKRYPMFVQLQDGGGTLPVFAAEGDDELKADKQPPMPGREVVSLFIQFYDSPWLFRLMRCAKSKCRTYQLVNAPRKSYLHGWYCAGCSKTAAATRSTSKARTNERERKLQACAVAWAKGEPKHADRRAWVVEQANNHLRNGEHIKRNFIALNLAEIQARAERMSNAKG